MFKGRLIGSAVETIYDSFYEALAEREDISLLQTDFCKAYDYVNHDALLHILKRVNAPPQAVFVEKVLQPSNTCYPLLDGNLVHPLLNLLQARLKFVRACPIFSLLFIIASNLLLVSFAKNHFPKKFSGFMNDFGLLLKLAWEINFLTLTF